MTVESVHGLVEPGTRFTRWRLRSRPCAVADMIAAAAGAGLFAVAAIDSVASWPSNRVLLSDRDLARVAGALLGPCWPWLLVSFLMVFGVPRRNRSRPRWSQRWPVRWPVPARVCLAAAALACAAVVAGGFALGVAKGEVRVLPGPRYEVSTLDLNQANWTSVSAAQFNLWQARFVREDGLFTTFGLVLTAGSLGLLQLHRRATRASQ